MFYKYNNSGYKQALEGVRIKTLVYGEKTLLAEFRVKGGAKLPGHSHPHEQTGYLVSGRMRLLIGNEAFDVEPGDSWCIPGNIEHSVDSLADSVAIEVFSPVREDYLPENPAKS